MTTPVDVDATGRVTGGAGGIVANQAVILGLASQLRLASAALGEAYWVVAAVAARVADDPYGAVSAAFAQVSEAAHLAHSAATAVSRCAEETEQLAARLLLAAGHYPWGADVLSGGPLESLWGFAEQGAALSLQTVTAGPQTALDALIVREPGLIDEVAAVIDAAPASLTLGIVDTPTTRLLAGIAPDRRGRVADTGLDASGPAGTPPRSLAQLVADLEQRSRAPGAAIDVRIVTGADGRRCVVVDLTGTDSWSPVPGRDPADVTADGRALDGAPTAYEQGVLAAMQRAGVRPADPVMLVGHSLGGMIAVNAARRAVASGRFHVTHVLTCGSPIGATVARLPASVQVLALENSRDAVPHLDHRDNPDRPSVTTVSAPAGDGTPGGDHSLADAYLPLARAADASADNSIRTFVRSAGPFLSGVHVTTHTFEITRR